MASFEKKTWKQRETEFPGRRRLEPTGTENVYDTFRDEGTIIQEGDPLNASNINNLEDRVGALATDAASQTELGTVRAAATAAQTTANAAMPRAGGAFNGSVTSSNQDRNGYYSRDIHIRTNAAVGVATNRIVMNRK